MQSLSVNSGHKQELNIFNLYIPPISNTVPAHYKPQLLPLTLIPNSIIAGDFNAKSTAWYSQNTDDARGTDIEDQLNSMCTLNDTEQYTHIPYQANRLPSSPDITFCSTNLFHFTTWTTKQKLPSDHLPIVITIETQLKKERSHITHKNYKKADWTKFKEETEQHFSTLNSSPINNIDRHIKEFNSIIQNADKKHIPKGNTRHYNPNFTPEIARLVRQRDELKHKSPFPHTPETKVSIQSLNDIIDTKIKTKKTENWKALTETLNHKTNPTELFKTIKHITNSQTSTSKTHAAIASNSQHIPTLTEQANILIKHYSEISHLKPTRTPTEKQTSMHRRSFPIDHTATPFTTEQTQDIIKKIKNSSSTGPDDISNIHLKHLGPHGIQALTDISNYTYAHCRIPNIWKHGTIITILKPNKDPTQPSSYNSITLLCTTSKITERLILNKITPHIPLDKSQHGFRALHSTSTLLTNLTQRTIDGINSEKPHRTLLTTIDISKAFDAIPRRKLITKIYNTNMENNTKRWLANYLSGRQAHVHFHGKSSQTRNFPNGVPQGSVLSPTLFNLYMHDMPTPPPHTNTNIASYADDITITTTHRNIDEACRRQQEYLDFFKAWVEENRLKIAPAKSTTTLLTSDRNQHDYIPNVTLNNIQIPHKPATKILGVTYNTSLTFSEHIQDIKRRCNPRLNALRAITGTDFGQQKETSTLVYKQSLRTQMSYASPAFAACTADTHLNTLQTIQNNA
ncbi:MAG: reverse transcriptase family protein, partial [Cyanobacteria bacterium J06553_1]